MNAYKPRNYQESCLDALASARDQGDNKALIVMASGLGKTITSAFDIIEYLKKNEDGRVLVLCHSSAIQSQTKEAFKKMFGDEYSYGMYNYNDKTTRKTDFLFANLQSINLHCDEFNPEDFSYIVVDEAHHSPATTYRQAIQHFKPQFLLGMTATPDRTDNAGLKKIFGKTVFEYRLESAIKDGWLSKVEYHIKTDDIQNLEYYLDSGKKISLSQLNHEIFIPKRDEEIARIIRDEISNMDNPTMVIFCQTIAHAERFARLMGDAVVIHSKLDAKTIKERLTSFRSGDIKTVCAVDMLNEGIDVPRTDVIVFLRVTQSKIVFTQQLGRGLRRTKSKNKVLVLDFVATADRLEMLFQLERNFKSSVEKYSRKPNCTEQKHFTLDVDSPVFRDRKVDIIELIEKARNSSCRYTNEELVQMLKDFADELGHVPSISEVTANYELPHFSTFVNRFGSFTEAIISAGLKPVYKTYTDDELIEMLKKLSTKLGRTPTKQDVNSEPSMPDATTYVNRFGKWSDLISRLGLEMKSVCRRYTDEQLLEALRICAERVGHIPMYTDFDKFQDLPSGTTYVNRFGGLMQATEKAGLGKTRPAYELSNDELVELYRKFAEELGRRPSNEDIKNNPNLPSPGCFRNRFGSIEKLGDSLGLPKKKNRRYNDDELIDLLSQFGKEIGHTPKFEEVCSSSEMPSGDVYTRHFSSFSNALELAGFSSNVYQLDNNELADLLWEFGKKLGRTPSERDVDLESSLPSSTLFKNRFGSFSKAIYAAGFTKTASSGRRKNKR